jgi:hypothetical protein
MELKDVTADMASVPTDVSQNSVPQADDSANVVATVDDVVEEKSETKADDGVAEVKTEEVKPEVTKDEDVPFFERPGVKERVEGIKAKYESKATYWDTIAEISQNDPEFRIMMIQKLENAGKLPVGTTENIKKQVSEFQQVAQQESQYLDNLPPALKEDIAAVREFRMEQEAVKAQQKEEVNNFFLKFEEDKPDIDKTANPARVRNIIFNMASEMVDSGKAKFEDAMEIAYNTVMHPEKIAERAKEKGQVEALVQANQEAASGLSSGGVSVSGKPVKLTESEKRAAELMGATPEEYRKFKDSGDEIFENI